MPKIVFNHPDGSREVIQARNGASIMETATRAGISGIVGECGGALACATCHVYISDEYRARAGAAGQFEQEMLEEAAGTQAANSRLACQIRMRDELDGIEVTVAARQ